MGTFANSSINTDSKTGNTKPASQLTTAHTTVKNNNAATTDTENKTASKFYCVGIATVVLLFLAEFVVDQKEHKHLYKRKETSNNILIGIGMFLISLVNRIITLSFYYFVYSFRLFTFGNSAFVWILAFFLCDFTFYWYHLASHKINWLWMSHSIHHSSTKFNLSVSLRQSWTTHISGHFLFWLWLPFIGFHPVMISIVATVALFYQPWLHTELIGKLHPVVEFIFNTPSHHRVHHASDLKYLDKNNGEVLIIWDRLFGTFHEEEEKPTYGLTKNLPSEDLATVMLSDWRSLFRKVFSARSFKIAINYLIQPPGWSPDNNSATVKELRRQLKTGG
jgi:sterol desaturase/sphingolipid hydroxylase (fatty acid hydroxylase superfamily)